MGKQSRRKRTLEKAMTMTPEKAKACLESMIDIPRASIPKEINKPSFASEQPLALVPMETPREWFEDQLRLGNINPYIALYLLGECSVIVTREYGRWHLSIAHPKRNPTWREISEARYRILPDDMNMAIILPSKKHYVNVHEFCYQMIEVHDAHLDLLNNLG